MNDLTLIIPAKNEPESLPVLMEEIKDYKYKKKISLSKDDGVTIDSVKNFEVEIIFQDSSGYGDALISGINATDTKYFCIFNADGSFNPSEIKTMIDKLEDSEMDFIFASRYQSNSGSDDDTFITYVGNQIFTALGKIFFRLPITDILYTFVVGKTNKAKELKLQQKDFTFCVELPIKAKKSNLSKQKKWE